MVYHSVAPPNTVSLLISTRAGWGASDSQIQRFRASSVLCSSALNAVTLRIYRCLCTRGDPGAFSTSVTSPGKDGGVPQSSGAESWTQPSLARRSIQSTSRARGSQSASSLGKVGYRTLARALAARLGPGLSPPKRQVRGQAPGAPR